jgi:drug/metabolite transporter, DME family
MSRLPAPMLVLLAALLFSTGGAVIKATSLTSWQVASLRSAIAALTLLAVLPASRSRWTWRTLAVGVAYAATLILFVQATKMTTAASAIFLQATAPLYIALLAPLFLGERARRADVVFMVVLAIGLAVFFVGQRPAAATAPDPLRGNVAGALSGATWAATVIGLRWLGVREPGGRASFGAVVAGNVIACLAALPWAWPIPALGAADAALLLFLGTCQIGLAYICLTEGIRRLPALGASLLLLLEPVLNPVWAWLVHGERPGGWAMAGGAIIISATAAKAWSGARR